MNLSWQAPGFLWLGGLLPALLALYIWRLRRRRRYAVRFSSLALLRAARPGLAWRRHLPFAFFLLTVGTLVAALARPTTVVQTPVGEATILLALDISSSMCSTDIRPTRLAAAQSAALNYVNSQNAGAHIGLVAFAGFAKLIQPPTTNHANLAIAINSLITSRDTAIGDGIHEAVAAIDLLDPDGAAVAQALPAGVYPPEIIVLLTDGVSTVGVAPLAAAQEAAARRIRIYTIGFGTAQGGENANCGGDPLGAAEEETPSGAVSERGIDEATLVQVSQLTGGAYYAAASAGELQSVFRNLPTAFRTETRSEELTVVLAAVGALLAALALLAAAVWQPLT